MVARYGKPTEMAGDQPLCLLLCRSITPDGLPILPCGRYCTITMKISRPARMSIVRDSMGLEDRWWMKQWRSASNVGTCMQVLPGCAVPTLGAGCIYSGVHIQGSVVLCELPYEKDDSVRGRRSHQHPLSRSAWTGYLRHPSGHGGSRIARDVPDIQPTLAECILQNVFFRQKISYIGDTGKFPIISVWLTGGIKRISGSSLLRNSSLLSSNASPQSTFCIVHRFLCTSLGWDLLLPYYRNAILIVFGILEPALPGQHWVLRSRKEVRPVAKRRGRSVGKRMTWTERRHFFMDWTIGLSDRLETGLENISAQTGLPSEISLNPLF